MKRRNNILFCCTLLTSLLLIGAGNNSNNDFLFTNSSNSDNEMQLVEKSFNAETVAAATLTYDFNEIKSGSSYVAFDAATFNKLDDNSTDYISSVQADKVYYGDSSTGQMSVTGLKLGSIKANATLKIVFKTNVTSVKLYATGYKTYNSAIKINGVQTVLTAKQDDEPQLLEYSYTEKSNVLLIETSLDPDENGYKMLRAWIKKMIVVEEGGTVIADSITSMVCASHYKLGIGSTLRLQAFSERKVVNGVEWSIISGSDFASLNNGRLKGLKYGTVVVKGTYGDIYPVYMTVYVGEKTAVAEFKSLKEIRSLYTASSSSISLGSSYTKGTTYGTYGKLVGFDGPTSANFYINDGSTTMYVNNYKNYSLKQLEIGRDYYLTGTLTTYNNLPEFNLATLTFTTEKISTGDYFKNTISSFAQWKIMTASYASKLDYLFNFYNVEARYDSTNSDGSINIYFDDDPTLVKVSNAVNLLGYSSLLKYGSGCDLTLNAVFTVSSKTSLLGYVSNAVIVASAHEFTGTVSSVSLSKSTANVALGKTLDVGALTSVAGTGDYNKNVKYKLDATTYGTISDVGVLSIGNTASFVGKKIIVTVSSANDATKTASITVTITESLKSSTITSTGLALTGSYADNTTGKSFAISDDTHTITVCYYQVMDNGYGIQMRYSSSKQSGIYNTTAAAYYISSVTLYATSGKNNKYSVMEVLGGTSAFSSAAATTTKATTTAADNAASATYTFASSDNFTFFKVQHTTGSGTLYFSSIEVTYRK